MKTINPTPLLLTGLCALAISFGTAAYAEKGAERLVNTTKASPAGLVQTANPIAHRCASCTDSFVSVVDKATKGPNHVVSKVARHDCAACDTQIVTEGTGKAKKDVAIHSCNMVVKPLCCASK